MSLFVVLALAASAAGYSPKYDIDAEAQRAAARAVASSLWCHGSEHQDHRHCAFRDLCYSRFERQFLFFHADGSYLSGLDHPDEQRQLVRLSGSPAAADGDGGAKYLDYVPLPRSAFQDFKIERVDRPVLLVARSSPHNFRQMVLDDMLSVFMTMMHLCHGQPQECFTGYTLGLTEEPGEEEPQFDFLYSIFFDEHVMWLDRPKSKEDRDPKRILCFSKAIVGLDHSGYMDGDIRAQHLEDFRGIFTKKLAHFHSRFGLEYPDIVVLNSHTSSQLLNEEEAVKVASREFPKLFKIWNATGTGNVTVSNLNLEEHSEEHVIRTVSKARVLIGPHGPHMVNALFLPPEAGVLEIFPYALSPDAQGLTRHLCELRGLEYEAVVTKDASKSIPYPNKAPREGGISHLDQELQASIKSMKEVLVSDSDPFATDDPAYLFRLNQKTRLDPAAVESAVQSLFGKMEEAVEGPRPDVVSDWIIPSRVHGVRCGVSAKDASALWVTWREPLNLKYLLPEGEGKGRDVRYEVVIEQVRSSESEGAEFLREASTRGLRLEVDGINLRKIRYLKIWIVALVGAAGEDEDDGEVTGRTRGLETLYRCDLADAGIV